MIRKQKIGMIDLLDVVDFSQTRLKYFFCFNSKISVKIINGHIWIYSIRNINKDDELSYDYGYEFDKDDYGDHICHCGSKNCIGYIISSDDRQKFKRFMKKNNV